MSGNQTWKSVTRPSPSFGPPQLSNNGQAPAVPPKPGGKMFVYVYEAPKPSKSDPSAIYYPRSDECVKYEKPKWKKKARKVFPVSRPSITSKGGIMFQKQRSRINDHVHSSSTNQNKGFEENHYYELSENQAPNYSTVRMEKPSPRSTYTSSNVKRRQKMKGPSIRPLRSPPPEWRAKVEAGYKLNTDLAESRASFIQYETGYQSAPEDDGRYDDPYLIEEDELNYARSLSNDPAATQDQSALFYTNAKRPRHINRFTRFSFISTPFTFYDFNARPVGWSDAYADNYYYY